MPVLRLIAAMLGTIIIGYLSTTMMDHCRTQMSFRVFADDYENILLMLLVLVGWQTIDAGVSMAHMDMEQRKEHTDGMEQADPENTTTLGKGSQ
jgi:amino acid permease